MASLSIGQAAQARIAREGRQVIRSLTSATLLLTILSGAFFLLLGLLVFASAPAIFGSVSGLHLSLGGIAMLLFAVEINVSAFTVSSGDIRGHNLALVLGRLSALGGCVVALGLWGQDYTAITGVLVSFVLGHGVSVLILLVRLAKAEHVGPIEDANHWKELLANGLRLHVATMGSTLLFRASVLILTALQSTVEAAFYQLSTQVVSLLLILPAASHTVFTAGIANSGPDQYWPKQVAISRRVLVVLGATGVGIAVLTPTIAEMLGGHSLDAATWPIVLLLPVVFPLCLAQLLTSQWIARSHFVFNSMVTSMLALANIGLALYMIPRHGLLGAVWADLIAVFAIVLPVQIGYALWCRSRAVMARL